MEVARDEIKVERDGDKFRVIQTVVDEYDSVEFLNIIQQQMVKKERTEEILKKTIETMGKFKELEAEANEIRKEEVQRQKVEVAEAIKKHEDSDSNNK